MSYNTDFINNKKYGADHINGIRTTIMTGGIIKKGETDCLVTLDAQGIHIGAGEALFDDGCRIEVTEDELIPHNGDCYVYFARNYYTSPALETGDELPENCIPLAQIKGGTATDLRDFATLKIPAMAPNRYMEKEVSLDFATNRNLKKTETVTFEDRTDVKYILFYHKWGGRTTKIFIDLDGDKSFGISHGSFVGFLDGYMVIGPAHLLLTVTKKGNRVTFDMECEDYLNMEKATVMAL